MPGFGAQGASRPRWRRAVPCPPEKRKAKRKAGAAKRAAKKKAAAAKKAEKAKAKKAKRAAKKAAKAAKKARGERLSAACLCSAGGFEASFWCIGTCCGARPWAFLPQEAQEGRQEMSSRVTAVPASQPCHLLGGSHGGVF